LPLTAATTVLATGTARVNCAGTKYVAVCFTETSALLEFYIPAQDLPFAHNIPGAWTANDFIFWDITYEVA
jgi:hypothetical protein